MSEECPKCGNHATECICIFKKYCRECKNEKVACCCMAIDRAKKKTVKTEKVTMTVKDAIELIYWARRYCDGRATYAPSSFNWLLKRVRAENQSLILADTFDQTLMNGGLHWPFAQDGMYDAQNGAFDATK